MTACCQVSTTIDSEAAAGRIATTLVKERLAACVQIAGPLRSVYRWENAVTEATEWLCTVKTLEARLPAVVSRIRSLHSYRQPEILAVPILGGDPDYLEWVREQSTPERDSG